MTDRRYKWVFTDLSTGEKLYSVGILADGTLYNPNGYPDELVRTAVLAANARCHERRSKAAKQAAETRRQRTAKQVYAVAKRLTQGGNPIGPRKNCVICGRGLSDQPSIARGIGSECWQDVLSAIEDEKARLSAKQENLPGLLTPNEACP